MYRKFFHSKWIFLQVSTYFRLRLYRIVFISSGKNNFIIYIYNLYSLVKGLTYTSFLWTSWLLQDLGARFRIALWEYSFCSQAINSSVLRLSAGCSSRRPMRNHTLHITTSDCSAKFGVNLASTHCSKLSLFTERVLWHFLHPLAWPRNNMWHVNKLLSLLLHSVVIYTLGNKPKLCSSKKEIQSSVTLLDGYMISDEPQKN